MVVVHVHYEKKKPKAKKPVAKKTTAKKSVAKPKVVNEYGVKIGDLFYSSWGYEQTNVNFYQVVGVTAKTVTVKGIVAKQVRDYGNGMSGTCVPVRDKWERFMHRDHTFSAEPTTCKVVKTPYGLHIKINDVQTAYPYNGGPKYFSDYY